MDRDDFIKRQRALAEFGEFALRCEDLQEILSEACRLIADALGTDFGKVVEIERDRRTALIRAGVGWSDGIVGKTRLQLNERSSETYAIELGQPVVTQNIGEEDRFEFPDFMKEHGVVAIVNVPIFVPGLEPYGVLQVDSRQARAFGEEDIEFLRTYAMVLGPVIDRLRKVGDLSHAAERFRLIVESARDYVIFLTDPDDIITDWLPGAARILGWSEGEVVGKPAAITFTPEDRANQVPEREVEQALREGTAPNVRWHVRKDGSRVFIDGQVVKLRYSDGRLRGFMIIGQDVTDRRRDEERQGVLLAELQHRVRNVLSMVRSIVSRGLGGDGTVAEFRADVVGRIAALARTQALLTRGVGAGVALQALVSDELMAHAAEEDRVSVSGPQINLASKAAEVVSLALHELATNAVKYGALGGPSGHVTISWHIETNPEGDWLRLIWQEHGVVLAPDALRREGFGTELITRRVPYELKGHGRIDFNPDGLRCEIEFPLIPGESVLQTDAPAAFRNAGL
jgi:PAS domain S-box-containing protein